MREHAELAEDITEIAAEVIRTHEDLSWLNDTDVTIGYLASNKKKTRNGKAVYADCRKVPDRDKGFIPFDFLITVYDQNVCGFNSDQMEILLYHELLHVGAEPKEDGTMRYFIVPHDIEDFTAVIDRYGEDWSRTEEMPEEEE